MVVPWIHNCNYPIDLWCFIMKELKDADMSLVISGHPFRCIIHGEMNKITKDGIWRCVSSYSYEKENNCRAGIQE